MSDLSAAAWPLDRLAEAVEALARCAGFVTVGSSAQPVRTTPVTMIEGRIDAGLDACCVQLGIEMEAVETNGAELAGLLAGAGPAVLRYRHASQDHVLLLLDATANRVRLLHPDLRISHYPPERLRAALCGHIEVPIAAEVESLLSQAGLTAHHASHAKRMLMHERLAEERFDGFWLLRMSPTQPFLTQLRDAGLLIRALATLALFAGVYALEIAGWWLIGRGALDGRLDPGWLVAWALLLLTTVPLRAAGGWLQGTFSLDAGALLKKRLLAGALCMDMQEVRTQGSGQLLSRVIESQALESLALNGGFGVLVALLELALAAWVLALGSSGAWHVLLLALWLIGTAMMGWRYYRRLHTWTRARLDLTHDLVEGMVGHRTRMAQQAPADRHEDEDAALDRYFDSSTRFDRAFIPLAGGLPRGWLVVGLLGLAPAFTSGNADPAGLAIALGGILLAYRAFGAVASGLAALMRAVVAAEAVAPLFAGTRTINGANASGSVPAMAIDPAPTEPTNVLLQARNLVYRHGPHDARVLDRCSLTIHRGDRLLLEGPSGGGKSTLASLLVGLKQQQSGLLLLDGLDKATRGDAWRSLSTAAPQFHENHILTGTLAFNLLMGRSWPPSDADLTYAESLCRELGLGDLLDRMPSGLMQVVGETGWQLSHGERSRVYLARALLQKAELVVLDESFAALDPETLDRCLRCTLSRASTLLVIAHP